MWQIMKRYLRKIQNSDEATKRNWLIGATAVTMVMVIGLWLIYMNSAFRFVLENANSNPEPAIGFWQIFKNGLTTIFDSINKTITNFISEITKSKTIIIK